MSGVESGERRPIRGVISISMEQLVRIAVVAASTNVLFQGALGVVKLLVGLRDI
jgi:hypothetical protein